jgi:phosphate starvation-inducible protein PhoH
MHNADIKQLMTTITRFGEGSKITIIGDSRQNDINEKYVALDFFVKEILGEDDQMFHFKFDRNDIVRDPLLIKIIDNYEKALAEGRIPNTKRKN